MLGPKAAQPYNVAALPLAAIGLLNPVIAAAAMGVSSVSVVANALSDAEIGVAAPRLDRARVGVAFGPSLREGAYGGRQVAQAGGAHLRQQPQ